MNAKACFKCEDGFTTITKGATKASDCVGMTNRLFTFQEETIICCKNTVKLCLNFNVVVVNSKTIFRPIPQA